MDVGESQARLVPQAASPIRTVSLLGATGSVGTSTIDLLKRGNGRYQVEAVTANRNAAQLAQLARELGARFAVVADPKAYPELKAALAGRLGDGGGQRLGRAEADARCRQARRDRGAGQQGMPGLCWRRVHAHGCRQ